MRENLFSWKGTIGRGAYLSVGLLLFAIKHNLDRYVATAWFGKPWSIFNYWVFEGTSLTDGSDSQLRFYATLVAIALPFIFVGVTLTVKRLRDAGLPLGLVFLFFLPFLNLLFFALLSALPSKDNERKGPSEESESKPSYLGRFIPSSVFGSAVVGVLMTGFFGFLVTVLSVTALRDYGWGLFVGLPFCLGLISVLVHGYHAQRSFGSCVLVSISSVLFAGACVFALAVEGVICLVMAFPLGLVLAFLGGVFGYLIQSNIRDPLVTLRASGLVILALPLMMSLEHSVDAEPPLIEVSTTIDISAPRELVWQEVIAFTEIPQPRDKIFRLGIAYPIKAEIDGHGVGATRRCVFSTGIFTEPIEVWDAPTVLRFGVTSQPPAMQETSLYSHVDPSHLNGYLNSRQGQFLLTRLPDGSTRLEGTTWYQNRFWPNRYWQVWSDYIIHRIHWRVLAHIKQESEEALRANK